MSKTHNENMIIRGRGIHEDFPEEEYHAIRACSASALRRIREASPAHLAWEREHPSDATPAMLLGSATHVAILEPASFEQRVVRCPTTPDGDRHPRRSAADKAVWADFEMRNLDRIILSPADYERCLAMRDAAWAHPAARDVLSGPGQREVSLFWDSEDGIACKARVDILHADAFVITDLKTTTSAAPEAWGRTVWTYGYYIQAAWYIEGTRALGLAIRDCLFVVVEKEPPYVVAVYSLPEEAIYLGRRHAMELYRRYAACERTGIWSAYGDGIIEAQLPAWAWKKSDAGELLYF